MVISFSEGDTLPDVPFTNRGVMKFLALSLALALSGCSGDYSGLGPAMAGGFANGLNQANAQNIGVQPTQGVGYQMECRTPSRSINNPKR
jgi:hypothetical protein